MYFCKFKVQVVDDPPPQLSCLLVPSITERYWAERELGFVAFKWHFTFYNGMLTFLCFIQNVLLTWSSNSKVSWCVTSTVVNCCVSPFSGQYWMHFMRLLSMHLEEMKKPTLLNFVQWSCNFTKCQLEGLGKLVSFIKDCYKLTRFCSIHSKRPSWRIYCSLYGGLHYRSLLNRGSMVNKTKI